MNATQLISMLAETIKARIPVLVQGAPGIGKSDIMQQAAADADADLIITHPAIEDPTVPAGLPFIVKGEADFLPFGALRRARNATRLTVWFADDLGQATPATQAAYMPLLDAARGNNRILGEAAEHIVFVAATNRRGDRAGVSGVLEPVKSRFGTIVELDVDLDSWCNWAIDHNVDPILIAFHRFKGGSLLSDFKPTGDLTNSPSPRTWSHVNKLIALNLAPATRQAAIAGAVGEGASVEFGAFEKSWKLLPNIDQILIDPSKVAIPDNPAVLYSLSTALAMKANPTTFPKIAAYVDRLVKAGSAEFGVLCVRDCLRRDVTITQSSAFVKLATSELGRLISGKD